METIAWRGRDGEGNVITGTLTIPTETQSDVDVLLTGIEVFPNGFTVPEGEIWAFNPNVSTHVVSGGAIVVEGTLRLRPSDPSVQHELEFSGFDENDFVGNRNNEIELTDVGLYVTGPGKLDAVGSPKTSWTNAVSGLSAGRNTVEVVDASGWQVGDELEFTPTAKPDLVSGWYQRYSTAQIVAIEEDELSYVITLDNNLSNSHPMVSNPFGAPLTCEVLNLTRNVKIHGTANNRSHIMWLHSHMPVHISDVEVYYMGPPDVLGRYPLHFHHSMGGSNGSVIESVVVHDCWQHAYVPHSSHNMTFKDCVAHDVFEDAYWWDQPVDNRTPQDPTNGLRYLNCVASLIRFDPQFRAYRISGFNLGRDNNNTSNIPLEVSGCVAVGVLGNTHDPDNGAFADSAGYFWPELLNGTAGVWMFKNNIAHNCASGIGSWQNDDAFDHFIEDSIVYNCGAGINHGAYINAYVYRNIDIIDCIEGFRMHAVSFSNSRPITFENIRCQVVRDQAVKFVKHTLGAGAPTIFRNCDFRGYGDQAVLDVPEDNSRPTVADFIDCIWSENLPHVVLTSLSRSGTRIREIENGQVVASHTR